jgi:hypothetical protein
MDHPYSLAMACLKLGRAWAEQGDLGQAERILERGLDVARRYDLPVYVPDLLDPLGLVVARSGRHAKGSVSSVQLSRATLLSARLGPLRLS